MEEYEITNKKCPKCGSENLDRGRLVNTYGNLGYKSDKQRFLSSPVNDIEARVCIDCGYIELYLNVEKLKRKLKK